MNRGLLPRFALMWLLLILTAVLTAPSCSAPKDFAVVVLPDTQYYACGAPCGSDPAIFKAQAKWIVDNQDALNIAYVAHVGDIVEHAENEAQWEHASSAMGLLEDPVRTGLKNGIAYGVAPGNHDVRVYKRYGVAGRDDPGNFDTFFGIQRFRGRSYYGGGYRGSNRSNYIFFSAGGMDFIVMNLDYHPNPQTLDWADAVLKKFSNRRAIVVSHFILSSRGFGEPGASIYEALKDNPNLFLMLCGHVHTEARRADTFRSNTVHTLLADYQDYEKGGNGWLRILEFSPGKNEIRVKTYSPTLDRYQTDGDSQFVLTYDMGGEK